LSAGAEFADVRPKLLKARANPINDTAVRLDVLRRSVLKCPVGEVHHAGQIVPGIMCGGAQMLVRITDAEWFARPIVITQADFRFVVAEQSREHPGQDRALASGTEDTDSAGQLFPSGDMEA
jgi:hypothetical protein